MGSFVRTQAVVLVLVAVSLATAGCLNPSLSPFPGGYPKQYHLPSDPPPAGATSGPVANPPPPAYPQNAQSVPPVPTVPPPPVAPNTPPLATNLVGAQFQNPPSQPLPDPRPATPAQPQPLPIPSAPPTNPHELGRPTAVGNRLQLDPNELPIDKAVQLSQQVEACAAENRALLARIKTLEANGLSREESLNETLREVETATIEVMKARTDMQAMKVELTTLRDRVNKVEADELETLRMVIDALEKLLDSPENK